MRHTKAAVLAGVGVAMVIAGCSSKPATTTSSAPTSPAANPALNDLLLSPDSINKAMGAKAMIVSGNYTDLLDDSSTVSDPACRITTIDADVDSYANSGYTAVHEQALQERGQHSAYYTDQAVVLFPSADKAAAFYASMAQRWPACSNRDFTRTPNGAPAQHWAVGPISNANGVLSNVITEKGMMDQNCERAITVSGAVAIDVSTCTHANAAGTAAGIAQQIAAKVQK